MTLVRLPDFSRCARALDVDVEKDRMQGEELKSLLVSCQTQAEEQERSEFGIDRDAARRKMSRYLLSHPGLWLVKIIQAAVAGGADQVQVTFARCKVIVKFTPQPPWDGEQILDLVMSGELPAQRALHHLVVGLRACAAVDGDHVEWSAGPSTVRLEGERHQVERHSEVGGFTLQVRRPSRKFAWRSLLKAPVSHALRQTFEDWSALLLRCWTSPIPILVDARPLRTGYDSLPHLRWPHPLSARRPTSFYTCAGLGPITQTKERPELDGYPNANADTTDGVDLKRRRMADRFLRWLPSNQTVRGAVALHTTVAVSPSLNFVLDGAVVECHWLSSFVQLNQEASKLDRPLLATRYVFGVRPDELDLSGFAVRDISISDLLSRSLPETRALALKVREHLPSYVAYAFDERRLLRNGIETLLRQLDRLEQMHPH